MLVELSVMEQRYHAVMEVMSGAPVSEVARRYGVSRQAVHGWLGRYESEGWPSWPITPTGLPVSRASWTPEPMAPESVCATRPRVPGFRWGLVRSAAL
jgi:transposase